MFWRLLELSVWRISKAKFAWKQAVRLEISPSIKDKKGKRLSAILNKFLMIAQSGLELVVCPQRFRRVPFSSVHTCTRKQCFQQVPVWRAFSKSSVFIDRFHRIRLDGSRIRKENVSFSSENAYVWTGCGLIKYNGPVQMPRACTFQHIFCQHILMAPCRNCTLKQERENLNLNWGFRRGMKDTYWPCRTERQ